jgi:NADP-dependent 3-hydroxy acid dehydrogenase YdfG
MLFYADNKELMQSVQGQYIWIIGASSGIGAATAKALSERGANLILSARRESQLKEVRAQLKGANHQVLAFDVSDHQQTVAAFQSVKRLDRVIFLAAVYDPSAAGRADIRFIHKSLQVNLGGVYNMLAVVTPFF